MKVGLLVSCVITDTLQTIRTSTVPLSLLVITEHKLWLDGRAKFEDKFMVMGHPISVGFFEWIRIQFRNYK